MKTKTALYSVLVFALFFMYGLSGCTKEEQKTYSIKYTYISPELTPDQNNETACAHTFKKYVETESKGKIKVNLFPGGQLGKFGEMIQGTMRGSIDIALINTIPLGNVYPESMILGIPGVFKDRNECTEILNGDWGKKFNLGIEQKLGLKVLMHYSPGLRHFTNSKKELKKPEDAKGLTFRVMESPVSIKMVESLGAKAVPIASSEMYVAMQNHVVDGQENPIPSIIQDLTYEVQKYLVLDGHFASTMMLIMNKKLYDELSKNQQNIITAGLEKGWEEGKKVIDRQEIDGLKFLEQKGMKVYKPSESEITAWHDIISKATHEYVRSKVGDTVVDELLEAVQKHRGK